ncbi:MAG TPA: slipin family protein [Syntrophomonadaceae bacterium]|nr:slipin family protein [Syntrophomonadaceae bacterium]
MAFIFDWLVIVILVVVILSAAIKIIPEYDRAVLFRLGRLVSVKGPGLIFIIPIVDKIQRVSLRVITYDVPPQEVITKDNVTTTVNAVLYYRVVDPDKAIVNVEQYDVATNQLAQTTLRSVAGTAELDQLLSEREHLNKTIQEIVDAATDPWGIKIVSVEIKDVVLPTEMQRAIARQAQAERDRRAAVIQAEGEKQASVKLAEAAVILAKSEGSLTLRMLRSLSEIANSQNNTILFPMPMEFGQLFPDTKKLEEKMKKQLLANEDNSEPSDE